MSSNVFLRLGTLLPIALVFLRNTDGFSDQPVSHLAEYVAAIRTAEEAWLAQAVEFRCQYRFAPLGIPFDSSTAGAWDKNKIDSFVRVDGSRLRYLVEMQSLGPGARRVGDVLQEISVGHTREFSNDSNVFRRWGKMKIDAGPPNRNDPGISGDGVVAEAKHEAQHVQNEGFARVHAIYAGLGWLPPYLWIRKAPVRLSVILEDAVRLNRPLKITPRVDGERLDISVRCPTIDGIAEKYSETDLAIVFHLPSGLWESCENRFLDKKATLREKVVVETKGMGTETVPVRIVWLYENQLRAYDYLEFRKLQKVDAGDFVLKFPDGIQVMDHINGMYFTTGTGVVDEQAAIRAFRERNGFRLARLTQSSGMKWLLIGGVLVVASFVVYFLRQHWRRILGVFIAVQFTSAMPCWADSSLEQLSDGTWVADYGTGQRVPVIQCGLRVTMFILDCAEIDYRVSSVSRSLRPDTRGSTLLEIRDVLRAHGLKVEGRKEVTKRKLKNWLSPNRLAIVPIALTRDQESGNATQSHYVVAMLDSSRQAVVADVPRRVSPFDTVIDEVGLKAAGGYVLLVEHGSSELASAKSLQLKSGPPVIDVGDIDLDAEPMSDSLATRSVAVENPNAFPVIVTELRASCGCFQVKWAGGIIGPNASVELPVVIVPAAWALGKNTKSLLIKSHGLADFVVSVRGNGISRGHKPAAFRVAPRSHELEFDHVSGGDRINLGSLIELTSGIADAVTVDSSVDWLEPSLTRLDDFRRQLTIEVALTPELLSTLRKGRDVEDGVVRGTQEAPPHESSVTVRLAPRRLFTADPQTVVLENSNPDALVVLRPMLKDLSAVWQLSKVTATQGRFKLTPQPRRELAFRIQRTDATVAGIHRVDCSLVSDDGDEFIHRVIISVPR